MKLNYDCSRAILLAIEAQPLGHRTPLNELKDLLNDYSENDIIYSCLKLEEANFIKMQTRNELRCHYPIIVSINELTIHGHNFLEDIRKDTIWEKTKETAAKVGSSSFSALQTIATKVISNIITNQLGF